jgi:hypothetical protein
MRTDGTTMWMRMPVAGSGELPGVTKEWLAMPASGLQPNAQLGFGSVDSAAGFLEAFRGIGGEVEEIGPDVVNGVEVTHYRAVFSLRDAIAAVPEDQRKRAEEALEQFEQLGASEMPTDVWLSDDGLPIRTVMRFDMGDSASFPFEGFSMEMTYELSDFGVPVEVVPPPADQVQEIDPAQLQELMTGGMGDAQLDAPA